MIIRLILISIIVMGYASSQQSLAQNVGIGLGIPNAKLHIRGSQDTSQLVIDAFSTQTRPLIRLRNNSGQDMLHIKADAPYNVFIGFSAGASNDRNSGWHNTFIGSNSGFYNTTGTFNTALGRASLYQNINGINNTALGFHTLFSNTSGNYNTAVGSRSLDLNQSGGANTAVGNESLQFNIDGYSNTAIGFGALTYTNASYNTAVGTSSLFSNTSGEDNTAVGFAALTLNTTASGNTAFGNYALANNITGHENTAIGNRAMLLNDICIGNTAVGFEALYGLNYPNSAGSGYTTYNTAIGVRALYNSKVLNGGGAYGNTAVGSFSMFSNTSGYQNTAIGEFALTNMVSGVENIAVGHNSGTAPNIPAGNNTISIGNYNILNAFSNQAFFGNLNIVWNGGNVGWSTFSDGRLKTNIAEDVKGLEFINRLRPVTYYRNIQMALDITGNKDSVDYPEKNQVETIRFSGFIAQEVERAAKESGYEFSGITHVPKSEKELYTLSYEQFVVPLVKAVQEQQVMIEELKKTIEELKKKIN